MRSTISRSIRASSLEGASLADSPALDEQSIAEQVSADPTAGNVETSNKACLASIQALAMTFRTWSAGRGLPPTSFHTSNCRSSGTAANASAVAVSIFPSRSAAVRPDLNVVGGVWSLTKYHRMPNHTISDWTGWTPKSGRRRPGSATDAVLRQRRRIALCQPPSEPHRPIGTSDPKVVTPFDARARNQQSQRQTNRYCHKNCHKTSPALPKQQSINIQTSPPPPLARIGVTGFEPATSWSRTKRSKPS